MGSGIHEGGRSGIPAATLWKLTAPLALAVQFALVSTLSFSLALALGSLVEDPADTLMIGALWAMISSIVVTQDTRSATIDTAWLRIIGSFIGALFGALYLTVFPFSVAGMGVLIGVVVLVCGLLQIPAYLRLSGLTAGIILVISVLNPEIPPFVNAAMRFGEVIIGSLVAVTVAWAWQYLPFAGEKAEA